MSIQANLNNVQARIKQAAGRSGRKAAEVRLLGVTKSASEGEIAELIGAGLSSFGESRVQQGLKRAREFSGMDWHLIGSLQTNKARFCRPFSLIHSLERRRLAQSLNVQAERWQKVQKVLVQINVSGETSKSGLRAEEAKAFVQKVLQECPHLEIRGLMTMAPFVEAEQTRSVFRTARELYDQLREELSLDWDTLSMGMTNDFEVAVEEGATLVRIGSALFAKEDQHE